MNSLYLKKLLKKETVIESASIVLLFTIVERIIQTFRGIIFARFLGPSEYGLFTLAIFFIPLVVTLAKLGIPSSYGRYVSQYESKAMLGDFFRKSYKLTFLAGMLITFICLCFSKQISGALFASTEYRFIIIICSLTIIPSVMYENLLYSFNGMRVFKMGALLRFGQFFLFTVISIPLVIVYHKAEFAVSANFISFVGISSFFGYIALKYILNSSDQSTRIEETEFYSKIFKYSVWFIATPIIVTLFNYMDRLMLNRFLGLKEVGIYSIALNFSNLLLLFGMIAGRVIMPNFSAIWESGDKERVVSFFNLGIKFNVLIIFLMAVILSLLKEHIISILYGQQYIASVPAVNILLIFSLLTSVYSMLIVYAGIIEKTYIHFVINTVGFISNVVLNYILIPRYQLIGAAIATTVSFSMTFIVLNVWSYNNGLKLRLNTILLFFIPVILILNNVVMGMSFLALVAIIFGSNFIVNKDEKIFFKRQVKKVFKGWGK